MFCKNCGKEIDEGWSTCPYCGEKVKQETTEQTAGEKKAKKPLFKRWWFIILVVVIVIFLGMAMMGGSDDTEGAGRADTSGNVENTEEKDTEQSPESDAEEIVENNNISSLADLYSVLQDNDSTPFVMSEKSYQFLTEHEDCFPAADYGAAEALVDSSIEYRHVEKTPESYGDKFMEISELYVISISETDTGAYGMFTEIQAADMQENYYYILYNGSLDVYKEDFISAIFLPIGFTSYDNISGGTTNAMMAAGSYIVKTDSMYE